MKYTFPAFITKEEDGYVVTFPDVRGVNTDGDTIEEALEYAEDALNLMLWAKEEEGKEIPKASLIETLVIPPHTSIALVKADTLAYKRLHDNKAVRKNVSIPNWLNQMIQNKNINLSNLLQKALIQELGIK